MSALRAVVKDSLVELQIASNIDGTQMTTILHRSTTMINKDTTQRTRMMILPKSMLEHLLENRLHRIEKPGLRHGRLRGHFLMRSEHNSSEVLWMSNSDSTTTEHNT